MARLLIAYTPNGMRVLRNVRTDRTGDPLILIDQNEVRSVTIDLTAYLDDAETISSATAASESVTASVTLASPLITVALSNTTIGVDGQTVLTITLSSGEVMRVPISVRRMRRFTDETSERDYV